MHLIHLKYWSRNFNIMVYIIYREERGRNVYYIYYFYLPCHPISLELDTNCYD